jgi:hypothetical protein
MPRRLSLVLTIGALVSALLILVLGIQLTVPFLGFQLQIPSSFPGLSREIAPATPRDEGFPGGLQGDVPAYTVTQTSDSRDCEMDSQYASYCYYVTTSSEDNQSIALMVQDIIRDENLEKTQEQMIHVVFISSDLGYAYATAYAFRSESVAKDFFVASSESPGQYTVIDGVYIYNGGSY